MDDVVVTPEEEAYWEWTQKSVHPKSLSGLYAFGLFFAPQRFIIGEWKTALLIIIMTIGLALLMKNVSSVYGLGIFLIHGYEYFTAKRRIIQHNEDLRDALEKKWRVKLPLSREMQENYGLVWR